MRHRNHFLIVILSLAFVLRLIVISGEDHQSAYSDDGGDTTWYLANGYSLATGFDNDYLSGFGSDPNGYPISQRSIPTPPLYLLFVGVPQIVFSRESAIIFIRLLQVVLGVATVYLTYRLATVVTHDERVGLLASGGLAVAPPFILETAQIASETLYIFLIVAAVTVYSQQRWFILVGVLLALATLTRAVLLLFPLGLALHLFMIYPWQTALKRAVILLAAYSLVVSTWTIHNLVHWNQLVIGGRGFTAFVYIGATDWEGPAQVDENLQQDAGVDEMNPEDERELYQRAAMNIISNDPLGYIQRRVSELAGAFAQPHGTLLFSGESLKDLALNWLREDRSLAGLSALTHAESFWPKLTLYIFYYTALIAGLVGMWLTRRRWRWTLPLLGFIVYTALVHLVLDAIPRYIFPTEVFWYVFAAVTLVALADRVRRVQRQESVLVEGERQWL